MASSWAASVTVLVRFFFFAGNVGYHLFLMGSEAAQRVNLVDIAYHDFAERGQFLLQTAYLGGIAALHGAEFFQ